MTFATQESFWNDFLQDDFDIEGFRAFYDSTDNGRIDIEKAMSEGRTMREGEASPEDFLKGIEQEVRQMAGENIASQGNSVSKEEEITYGKAV